MKYYTVYNMLFVVELTRISDHWKTLYQQFRFAYEATQIVRFQDKKRTTPHFLKGGYMVREHMSTSFDNELNCLRSMLLEMGGKVELMISGSVKALMERDSSLATRVIDMDHEINHYEVEIDEKCLDILALRQPTACDLRFITISMKIVTDLERIGDKCTNIAKRARKLNEELPLNNYIDIHRLGNKAEVMVKEALDAFVRGDVDLAAKVCNDDAFVDELNEQLQHELLDIMITDKSTIQRALKLNYVVKSMDRIADHATNIAELVIFMVRGKDIRHTMPKQLRTETNTRILKVIK